MSNMSSVDYVIPEQASPIIRLLIDGLSETKRRSITVFEIGVSYGINPALARCNLKLDDLYEFYRTRDYNQFSHTDDNLHFRSLRVDYKTRFIGLDRSINAVNYAINAGLIDDGIVCDMENHNGDQWLDLIDVDLVISTGTIGYVGHKTISKVMSLFRQPKEVHHAHFVASPFRYDTISNQLETWHLHSKRANKFFIQRRFTDQKEVNAFSIDNERIIEGIPSFYCNSHLLASLYISSPRESPLCCSLFDSIQKGFYS
jgi:hypothetical protein